MWVLSVHLLIQVSPSGNPAIGSDDWFSASPKIIPGGSLLKIEAFGVVSGRYKVTRSIC